jgi:hypothetical protein
MAYKKMGDYAKAEPMLIEALQICQKALGRENPDTAASLNNLGSLYRDLRDYGKAEPLYRGKPASASREPFLLSVGRR